MMRQRRSFASASMAALAVVCALLLSLPLRRLTVPAGIDFVEGWNAYQATRVLLHEPLYVAPETWTPVNYPPLSFHGIAVASSFSGLSLWLTGRLVSLAAFAVVAVALWVSARRLQAGPAMATLGSLVWVGLVGVALPRYIAMNDPQLSAEALATLAFMEYARARAATSLSRLAAIGMALVVAGFIKHNLVAVPVTIAVDLTLADAHRGVRWATFVGAVIGAGLAFVQLRSAAFLTDLLLARTLDVGGFARTTGIAGAVAVPVALIIRWTRAWSPPRLVVLFLGTASLSGVLLAFGSGTDVNVYFAAFEAVALLAATTPCHETTKRVGTICLLFACLLPMRVWTPWRELRLQARRRDTATDAAFIRSHGDDAYCEQPFVCFIAGAPMRIDPFAAPELVLTGRLAEDRLVERLAHGAFSVIQLDAVIEPETVIASAVPVRATGQRLTVNVLRAVADRYCLSHTSSNGAFYVVKPPLESRCD